MKRLPLLPLRNKAIPAALCLAVALACGCKKKEEAPKPAPAPAAPKPAPPASPTTPAPQPPVQNQASSARTGASAATGGVEFRGRRDPFKPLVEQQPKPATEQAVSAAPKGEQLPIQSYEVAKFKVSGILVGIKQNRALLIDPQGKPYVVQEGMAVGNHEGRITRITPTSVEVVERFRDQAGRVKKRTIVLTLAKKR